MRRSHGAQLLVPWIALLAGTAPGFCDGEGIQELVVEGPTFASVAGLSVEPRSVAVGLDTVTMQYGVTNSSAQPLTTDVTLRLPPLDLSDPDVTYALPTDDPVNFIAAAVTVDGAPVPLTFRQSAEHDGHDVTRQLREAKLPLLPGPALKQQLATVPPEALLRIVADGLLKPNGTAQDGTQNFVPAWTVKTSASRKQRIEPGHASTVEARLKTSLGASQDTMLRKSIRQQDGLGDQVASLRKRFCVEDAMVGGIDRIAGSDPENTGQLGERRLAVRLPATPHGVTPPRITVDKGATDNLVSTCLTGLKKTAPATFERDPAAAQPLPSVLRLLVVGRF